MAPQMRSPIQARTATIEVIPATRKKAFTVPSYPPGMPPSPARGQRLERCAAAVAYLRRARLAGVRIADDRVARDSVTIHSPFEPPEEKANDDNGQGYEDPRGDLSIVLRREAESPPSRRNRRS
jgi:hypothetical protein